MLNVSWSSSFLFYVHVLNVYERLRSVCTFKVERLADYYVRSGRSGVKELWRRTFILYMHKLSVNKRLRLFCTFKFWTYVDVFVRFCRSKNERLSRITFKYDIQKINVLGGKHRIVTLKNILNLDVRFLLLHCRISGPTGTKTVLQYCF